MIINKKLEAHRYSQCHIEADTEAGIITFYSYNTPVVYIGVDGYVYPLPFFRCSATTRKQVGYFLKEYTCTDYMSVKNAYLTGYVVHMLNDRKKPVVLR